MRDEFIRKQVGRPWPPPGKSRLQRLMELNRAVRELGVNPRRDPPVVPRRRVVGRTPEA